MSHNRIMAALDQHLLALQTDHVAFPAAPYRKSQGQGYLRVDYLPAGSDAAAIGAGAASRERGLYQVTVCEPSGAGLSPALVVVDGLKAHFRAGQRLPFEGAAVTIEAVSLAAPELDANWIELPLTIRWRSDVLPTG